MEYVKESILKPGTEIKFKKQFGFSGVGTIKGVWIGGSSIEYQVCYFYQGELKTTYIPIEMFDIAGEPLPVGFQITKE